MIAKDWITEITNNFIWEKSFCEIILFECAGSSYKSHSGSGKETNVKTKFTG